MKILPSYLLAGLLLVSSASAALVPRTISMDDVPAVVQQSLQKAGVQVTDVARIYQTTDEGRELFDFELKRDGELNPRVLFAADGTLLRDGRDAAKGATEWPRRHPDYAGGINAPPEAVRDLPAPVREALRRHAAGRRVEHVRAQEWEGDTVYEVKLEEEGLDHQFHLAADGEYVEGIEFYRNVRTALQDVPFQELPGPVQETVRREVADLQQILAINKIRLPVPGDFRVTVRGAAIAYDLILTDEGEIVYDNRAGVKRVTPRATAE